MSENTPNQTQTDTTESWHVQVAENDVRVMTLEQLDEAFSAGLIVETTNVWRDGMDGWLTLGEMAGLGGDDEAEEPAAAAQEPSPALRPQQPQPVLQQVPTYMPTAQQPAYAPIGSRLPSRAPHATQPQPATAGQGGVPMMSVVPMRSAPAASGHGFDTRPPLSVAPMAVDLGELDLQIKPKSKVGLWALGLVAAAGVGLFAYNASFALNHNKHVPAIVEELAPVAAAAPARAVESTPVKTSDEPKPAEAKSESSGLGSKMATSLNLRTAKRAPTPRRMPQKKKRAGGGRGMSSFDPMNGQL